MKSFVFCTSYSESHDIWEKTYKFWVKAVQKGKLQYNKIFLIDDGSPVLPNWKDSIILNPMDLPKTCPIEKIIIIHFENNLGHKPLDIRKLHEGWHRSFMFSSIIAEKYQFNKIIHVESDAFIISERLHKYVNEISNDWNGFWSYKHNFSDTAIQIIAGNSINDFIKWRKSDINFKDNYSFIYPEYYIPFTNVSKKFYGDRWGEDNINLKKFKQIVPLNADYACQIKSQQDCWWL